MYYIRLNNKILTDGNTGKRKWFKTKEDALIISERFNRIYKHDKKKLKITIKGY